MNLLINWLIKAWINVDKTIIEKSEILFGYVSPYKPELKIKEYNMFRAYYCGLCKTMGNEYNQLVRMGLNYDLSFLGLLLSSLKSEEDHFNTENCIAHPINKRMIIEDNKALIYASTMSVILIYFKLRDDWNDDRSLKALISSLAFNKAIIKAKKENLDKYVSIEELLLELSKLERNKCHEIDEVADIFAKIMEEISCPDFIENDETKRILKFLGYNLGRWIYIIDAFDDIEKDIKKKSYNPLLLQYKYNFGDDIESFIDKIKDEIEFTLTFTLENISKAFELLDIRHNKEILDNIVYLGMRDKMERVLARGGKENEKSI